MEINMPQLTKEQIDFVKSMTVKQRVVLKALAMFDWYMSASERADNELYELIKAKLARCYLGEKDIGLLSWGATAAGKLAVLQLERSAPHLPGPSKARPPRG
jgi:hypothetical protein